MSEESDLVAKIITNDINTLVEDLNNVIKAHNVLVDENQQLKEELKQVLDDILKAFENNNCIDWNFTEIRKKYNFDLLKGDKK